MLQASHPPQLPLVGRSDVVVALRRSLELLSQGGGFWFVSGESGAGKTRLAAELSAEASRAGVGVATGRAYPVEAGVPYALFADALQPVTRRLGADGLMSLTRGVAELGAIFPWLPRDAQAQPALDASGDFRSRLHWHFTQFVQRLAEKQPFVIVLEDLHWADASSLELLHFMARQLAGAPVLVYCTHNSDYESPSPLHALEKFLSSSATAELRTLEPLSRDDVGELVRRMFDASTDATAGFVNQLFGWTRGNPFFIEETLKALIASGDLRQQDGRWTGWETEQLRLPPTVRDAVRVRLGRLSSQGRHAADVAAVLGSRIPFDTLAHVLGVPVGEALDVVEELRRCRVLEESADSEPTLDFVHPLVREALYDELGRLRRSVLHSTVALALEERYGAAALEHADELAYHFAHARAADARKAATYLRAAGERALHKYANREAGDYLTAALQHMTGNAPEAELTDTMEALARARQRLGEYEEALPLWDRVQERLLAQEQPGRAAAVARRAGLALFWSGRHEQALIRFQTGLSLAVAAGDAALQVRLGVARAACLQNLGRLDDALDAASQACDAAAAGPPSSQAGLLGRAHRTLQQIHLWRGDGAAARLHGEQALALAQESGDRVLEFTAHWAMCVLESFSGNAAGIERHLAASSSIAAELRSPVLRLWVSELSLEYATARGDWDEALSTGEDAIRMARALQQQDLLPRLLVWTALIHLGRGDFDRGETYVEEAWQASGAARGVLTNMHAVLPAYIGRAAARLARCDYRAAIEIGEEGLALADRAGYAMWVVHRLLPIIAESHLWLRELDGARRAGERLRQDSERIGHRLAMAWAAACDALVEWLSGDSVRGAVLLREAAEQLEALPFVPDATRLRRQLAGRLADIGDREGALRELRLVHERLLHMGAEAELQKARQQFRQLGTRPPPLGGSRSAGVLTSRELAVAERTARHMSAKAVARDLGISARTVDAHLANIYRKLAINSRAELAELFRRGELQGGETTVRTREP